MLVQNLWTKRRMTRIEAESYASERERIHQPFFHEVTTMGEVFVNYPYAFARIGRRIEAAQRNYHIALAITTLP
jgi:hypothetical protein